MKLSPLLLFLTLASCAITEKNITGSYYLPSQTETRLTLYPDNNFEFIRNYNGPGPQLFDDSADLNFRTSGSWKLTDGKLILNSFTTESQPFTRAAKDSIIHNTDITSFSFWNQAGEPVPIRLIRFPENRTKLHKSHVVSFFAEDFGPMDTLEFHFYGYMPFRWVSPSPAGPNNQHRITLFDQVRYGYFNNQVLIPGKNKLTTPGNQFFIR
jgi:hypothetical protein